jgi:hypothetical protein
MLSRNLIPVLVFTAGCGAQTGSGSATAAITLTAANGPATANALTASPSGADAQGSIITVTSAKAYIRDVRLYMPQGSDCGAVHQSQDANGHAIDHHDGQEPGVSCDSNATVHIRGPFLVDLLSGVAPAGLQAVELPAKTYTRVDVRLDDANPSEGIVASNDPLAGKTLLATGNVTANGNTTPFQLALSFNEDARFEDPNGISLGAGLAADVMLHLDVNAWFANLPITQCMANNDLQLVDGAVIIADGGATCSDIENNLKDAIRSSAKLEKN